MAQPKKQGLDYFPFDCYFDNGFKLMQAECGLVSIAVVVKLFQKIYSEEGYYADWNDDVCFLFADECKLDVNELNTIIAVALKRGIFDKEMYEEQGILTSKKIQETYIEATSRRKNVTIDERYDLIMYTSCQHDDDKSQQSKVKESKVNQSKVKESVSVSEDTHTPTEKRYGKYSNVVLTDSELEELKTTYHDWEDKIEHLSEYMASSGKVYQSHFATINMWAKQDKQNNKCSAAPPLNESSYDVDEFFAAALERSYNEDYSKKSITQSG